MTARVTITKEWEAEKTDLESGIALESCEVLLGDLVMGRDAFRVTKHGKPIRRGKGFTHPFVGESAWMSGERLYSDEVLAARFTR